MLIACQKIIAKYLPQDFPRTESRILIAVQNTFARVVAYRMSLCNSSSQTPVQNSIYIFDLEIPANLSIDLFDCGYQIIHCPLVGDGMLVQFQLT